MISGTVIPGVPSRYNSALERMSPASISRTHSSVLNLPVRKVVPEISASIDSNREASCSDDISSEKKATRRLHLTDTCLAIFSAKLVLPIPGRAANKIRSERFRPVITLSNKPIPVGIPRYRSASSELSISRRSKVSNRTSLSRCRPLRPLSSRIS